MKKYISTRQESRPPRLGRSHSEIDGPLAGGLRVADAAEDGDAEQQRKREHYGAGWDVGMRAKREHETVCFLCGKWVSSLTPKAFTQLRKQRQSLSLRQAGLKH